MPHSDELSPSTTAVPSSPSKSLRLPEKSAVGRGVFLAEFDDEYQAAARLSLETTRARTRSYFLLAPTLLLHPAYVWQARTTHTLVMGEMSTLLTPPYAQVALGDSQTLPDYMSQRMGKLSSRHESFVGTELKQYQRWGGVLGEESVELEARFAAAAPVQLTESRDTKFRRLIIRDLSGTPLVGTSLRDSIIAFTSANGVSASQRNAIIRGLRSFASQAGLVSLDSVSDYLDRRGLRALAHTNIFFSRLLSIYYQSNIDESYVVAGLPSLDPDDPTIHPYDPDLFWAVVGHVFGEKTATALAFGNSKTINPVLLKLKHDSDWSGFISDYALLRIRMDRTLKEETEALAEDLAIASGYARLKMLPRIWREQKRDLIISMLGMGFAGPGLTTPNWVTVGGALVSTTAGVSSMVPLRRFLDEYNENYVVRLRRTLRRSMRMAKRQR